MKIYSVSIPAFRGLPAYKYPYTAIRDKETKEERVLFLYNQLRLSNGLKSINNLPKQTHFQFLGNHSYTDLFPNY